MWIKPLDQYDFRRLKDANKANGPMEIIDGPIGPMIKLWITNGQYAGKIFYCGGDSSAWMDEDLFLKTYPEYKQGHQYMTAPEFDLNDMEIAEIIIEEMK